MDEIIAPDLVECLGTVLLAGVGRNAPGAFLCRFRGNPESFAFPDPVQALGVDLPAVTAQQLGDGAIARPRFPCRDRSDRLGQRSVLQRFRAAVTVGGARLAHHPAGPALAHIEGCPQVVDSFSAANRAHHFPRLISLSMSMSRACSATSFLSREFSFSSSLRRSTVGSSAPSNCFYQRW